MKTDLNTNNQSPLIWNYTDPVAYLKAHFDHRKSQVTGFSYATWAEELGLKSRSFLRLVLIGKRSITTDTAELFAKALKLPAIEKQYFLNLVKLSRATTLEEKEVPTQELAKLKKTFALKTHNILEIQKNDLFEFLSSYKIPRLQVLLNIEGIQKTAKVLSQIMNAKESEVQHMLEVLGRMGFAAQTTEGHWVAQESKLMTPDALGNVALQSFHKKSLEEAILAIDLPTDTRRFQSLVMALTPEQFKEVHQEIRQHLEFILKKFEDKTADNKRVYQINLNLIPVTGSIIREDLESRANGESSESRGTK
jgi:uncharacterized protein (TIGR02147 family)